MFKADGNYFSECLAAGHGGVRVVLDDGTTDLIAGNRYLEQGTQIRVDVVGGELQVIYLGTVIKSYARWREYSERVSLRDL